MNIIQIGLYPLSAECIKGGIESSTYGLTQSLLRAGHVVDVIDCPRISGKDTGERNRKLTIHRYANHGTHNQDALQRATEIIRDAIALHPDIVHIHGTSQMSQTIFHALKNNGIPVVLTVHGLAHEEKKQALRRHFSLKNLYQYILHSRAEFDLLNEASPIIVDTEYVSLMIDNYYSHHHINALPEKIVIPQGISEQYYQLTCDSKSKTILSVGAISARKGHLYTIEMFNLLRQSGVEARLVIIGSLADTNYYEMMMQKKNHSTYSNDITIQTNVSQQELFEAYEHASIFVLHSQEESQGIVFAEAMATGMPVVATNVGGIPYVVENEKSGFLCNYGDIDLMAEKVGLLLSNKTKWESMSSNARNAAKKYDWNTISTQITNVYRQCL